MASDDWKIGLLGGLAGVIIFGVAHLSIKADEAIETLKLIDKHQRIIINRLESQGGDDGEKEG